MQSEVSFIVHDNSPSVHSTYHKQ